MAAREIECDAEITCQSNNFHRSDIQDSFFSSCHRTVVVHSSSTSSNKRLAGIRTFCCRAQRLQCAPRTSDTPANLVERHFFLRIHAAAVAFKICPPPTCQCLPIFYIPFVYLWLICVHQPGIGKQNRRIEYFHHIHPNFKR